MIGVAATADELTVAEEFFELFKTPWEPAVPGRDYAALLSNGQPIEAFRSARAVVYGVDNDTCERQAGLSGGVVAAG